MNEPGNRNESICALVVTYDPSSEQAETILALGDQFDNLIVVDNTPAHHEESDMLALLLVHSKAILIRNQSNLGMAAALNIGVQAALEMGYRWVVTLDQDSRIKPELVLFFRSILHGDVLLGKIGVVGANYINANNGRIGFAANGCDGEFALVRCVITSGSLLNLDCYQDIGRFNEKYFIDMVDTEYCYRARLRGYTVAITIKPLMRHAVGKARVFSFLGRKLTISLHPAFRQYYIFRNTLYTVRKYFWFDTTGCLAMLCLYLPQVALKAIFFGQERMASFRRIVQGIRDGLFRFPQKKSEE